MFTIRAALLLLLLSPAAPSRASSILLITSVTDTSIRGKPYKINEQQFMEKYGTDDSSRALIRYFFHHRSVGLRFLFIPPGAGLIISAVVILSRVCLNWLLFLYLCVAAEAVFVLMIIGGVYLLRYTRKKLLRLLLQYHSGGSIRRRIAQNHYFIKQLNSLK
jgi:hypothetical protein